MQCTMQPHTNGSSVKLISISIIDILGPRPPKQFPKWIRRDLTTSHFWREIKSHMIQYIMSKFAQGIRNLLNCLKLKRTTWCAKGLIFSDHLEKDEVTSILKVMMPHMRVWTRRWDALPCLGDEGAWVNGLWPFRFYQADRGDNILKYIHLRR